MKMFGHKQIPSSVSSVRGRWRAVPLVAVLLVPSLLLAQSPSDNQQILAQQIQQLTDAMAQLIGKMPFHAVKTDCARYDCGDKVGFLHANIAVGLSRPDIAPAIKKLLKDLDL